MAAQLPAAPVVPTPGQVLLRCPHCKWSWVQGDIDLDSTSGEESAYGEGSESGDDSFIAPSDEPPASLDWSSEPEDEVTKAVGPKRSPSSSPPPTKKRRRTITHTLVPKNKKPSA